MQENKKQLDEKVEAMRTVKETAEQPEKEAKERHLKAWEGKFICLHLLWSQISCLSVVPAVIFTTSESTAS